MKILAIDTSCDETAAAVTEGTTVLSNVVWSHASLHAKFGGIVPSLAQRQHEERIDFVVDKAVAKSQIPRDTIEVVAVTCGPGLAIALGVGIKKAKELAVVLNAPIIGVNHVEGHILSPLAKPMTNNQKTRSKQDILFPCLALVVSGGKTQLIRVWEIGKYEILAETVDDALGEALDKAARMLGLGYPGGAILEKMARKGNPKTYPLPLPMAGREGNNMFSYSGLKTAMWRLISQLGRDPSASSGLVADQIYDLAAGFQNRAFEHLTRVVNNSLLHLPLNLRGKTLLVGGGVGANVDLRKRLRKLGKSLGIKVLFPYSAKLYGDNAAMIGVAAGFKAARGEFDDPDKIDRLPRWRVDEV